MVNSRGTYPEDENFSVYFFKKDSFFNFLFLIFLFKDDELNYLAYGAFFYVQDFVPSIFKEYFVHALKHTWAMV
jgi:hypothetical protein